MLVAAINTTQGASRYLWSRRPAYTSCKGSSKVGWVLVSIRLGPPDYVTPSFLSWATSEGFNPRSRVKIRSLS